jgi:hypothetical protein
MDLSWLLAQRLAEARMTMFLARLFQRITGYFIRRAEKQAQSHAQRKRPF